MRVQFVHREGGEIVERGKTYDVISIECGWYRIDDEGDEEGSLYPPSFFDVVKREPVPPTIEPLGPTSNDAAAAYFEERYGVGPDDFDVETIPDDCNQVE